MSDDTTERRTGETFVDDRTPEEKAAGIAKMLRSLHPASARGLIEPPDMGRPSALSEATSEIRDRIALPPGADRGFIQPPDLGKPGDVGFIEPPDMGREGGGARLEASKPSRVHVPYFLFRSGGSMSTDPVVRHPYPPPRVVEWEYWNARADAYQERAR